MEPPREELKPSTPRPEEKQKRFRIVKLEERIAPSKGGAHGGTNGNNCHSGSCEISCGCSFFSIE
jgi:hypothetical protein